MPSVNHTHANAVAGIDESTVLTSQITAIKLVGSGITGTVDSNGVFTITDSGGGGGGSTYEEVDVHADLPAAADHSGEIYVVRTDSGTPWFPIGRKMAGLWRSNGSTWSRLGDWLTAFRDSIFRVYNDADTTKQAAFDLSGIPTATTRTYILPNANTTLVGTDVSQTLTNKAVGGLAPAAIVYGGF